MTQNKNLWNRLISILFPPKKPIIKEKDPMAANRNLADPLLKNMKTDNNPSLHIHRVVWHDEVVPVINKFLTRHSGWSFMCYMHHIHKCIFFCHDGSTGTCRYYVGFIDDLEGGQITCSLELAIKMYWTVDRRKTQYR